jgi:aryl-alcohol dehydrogenase-like predicted oxidoreductase
MMPTSSKSLRLSSTEHGDREGNVKIDTTTLRADFEISRLCKGNWQIADDHSDFKADLDTVVSDMAAYAQAGISTFVCGDIYAGVEERIGVFRDRYRARFGAEAADKIKVLTTYVPGFLDESALRSHNLKDCEASIDRSLRRLRQERLDLVQMHWWNYEIPGNVEMALMLKALQAKGKIHLIGATNYDVPRMREMFDAGVDIASHTVQYSVLDRRPEHGMAELCARNECKLLCYGAVGGGLISEKWLGLPDPGAPAFENVSLDKYYRIVLDFGGWELFQRLLEVLASIAQEHGVSLSNVACRYALERRQVAAVIVGARHAAHLAANLRLFSYQLDAEAYRRIDAVLAESTGPRGDCYEIDRLENRDALEEVKPRYHDVENGRLVQKTRAPVILAEPYAPYQSLKK